MISVRDDLLGETLSLFVVSQFSSWFICTCRSAADASYLGCCDMTARSTMAYDMRCVLGSVGAGMSCM